MPYAETYAEQYEGRLYNVKMLDGALIQMTFDLEGDELIKYRLAFLSSPDLLEFQNYPEIYLNENTLRGRDRATRCNRSPKVRL